MVPEELFKRRQRHNNTPQSILLIITNFVVVSLAVMLFTAPDHINWFFWVVLGLMAGYNFYTIRRNIDEYNRVAIIAYVISMVALIVLVFVLKGSA